MPATNYYNRPIITEADIRLFLRELPRKENRWWPVIRPFFNFTLIFGVVFFLLNAQTFLSLYSSPYTNQAAAPTLPTPNSASNAVAATSTPLPTPTIPESTVAVGNLGISAPISWDVPLVSEIYTAKLLDGVIHIQGTAKPGQQGMAVITGHSSNYPWIKGSYNSVFAPLSQAQVGQAIEVNYQNKQYIYKISKIYEVKPDDLTPLRDGSRNGIRLITCTPLGTALRRLVVEADQIQPDPSANTPFTTATFTGTIPAAR